MKLVRQKIVSPYIATSTFILSTTEKYHSVWCRSCVCVPRSRMHQRNSLLFQLFYAGSWNGPLVSVYLSPEFSARSDVVGVTLFCRLFSCTFCKPSHITLSWVQNSLSVQAHETWRTWVEAFIHWDYWNACRNLLIRPWEYWYWYLSYSKLFD